MNYNVSFDICAFLVSLTVYCMHKSIRFAPLLQNKRFTHFSFSIMAFSILDACYHFSRSFISVSPVWLVTIICYAFFIAMLLPEYRFWVYTLSLSDTPISRINRFEKFCLYVPLAIVVALSAINIRTGCLFKIENGEYVSGKLTIIIFAISLFYLVYGFVVALQRRSHLDIKSRISTCLYVIIVLICVAIQVIWPSQPSTSFGSSIGLLMMFLTIQKPQSYIDETTGLLNKAMFSRYFGIKSNSTDEFHMVFLYIEDLKLANEAIGASAVDSVLIDIGKFLENFAKNRVFYLGASTFCAVVHNSNRADYLIRDIEKRFSQPWNAENASINLSFRVLKLCCPDDVDSIDSIHSYIQCLSDIRDSKNKWIFRAGDLNIKSASRELAVEGAIKRAIENKSFTMYYQPIISTKSGKVISAEALIRLIDEQLGFIPPDEFIPIAERNGTILKIGEIIFEEVFEFMRQNHLHEKGLDYVEINLSVIQCLQENFGNRILDTMKQYNIDHGRVNLEITETATAFQSRALFNNIKFLAENSISISLDDFGSGYSNMNSILDLPLDIIKFDKHMIDMASTSERGKVVLASSAAMVQNMNMKIVAEGVETKEQYEELKSLGVDYIQGFYFSKPLPDKDFLEFVEGFNCGDLAKKYL